MCLTDSSCQCSSLHYTAWKVLQAGGEALIDLAFPFFSGTIALLCLMSNGKIIVSYVDMFTPYLWRECQSMPIASLWPQ